MRVLPPGLAGQGRGALCPLALRGLLHGILVGVEGPLLPMAVGGEGPVRALLPV